MRERNTKKGWHEVKLKERSRRAAYINYEVIAACLTTEDKIAMKNNPSYIRNNKELLKRMKALYEMSMIVTEDMFDFDFKDVDNSDAFIDCPGNGIQKNSLSGNKKDILL